MQDPFSRFVVVDLNFARVHVRLTNEVRLPDAVFNRRSLKCTQIINLQINCGLRSSRVRRLEGNDYNQAII